MYAIDGLSVTHRANFTPQSIEMAKDVVFPTRPLRRQLTQAQQRLRDMQDELELVKEQEARERRRRKRRRYVVSQILVKIST